MTFQASAWESGCGFQDSVVIWANHNLRAAISAMREVSQQIRLNESLVPVESRIAPVHQIFELANQCELDAAERRYLPAK